jgi:type I restriction enzyme M protein
MNQTAHNKLISFIWSIADDCLRDIYVRNKYRDVILPMVVLRRLDALLEPTKDNILNEVKLIELDENDLKDASGYMFYNTIKWILQKFKNTATNSQQIAKLKEYKITLINSVATEKVRVI